MQRVRAERRAVAEENPKVPSHPPHSGTSYSVTQILNTVMDAGSKELEKPVAGVLLSAFIAGLLVSFALPAGAFLWSMADDSRLQHALGAAGYPLGFVFAVVANTQLYAKNTLNPILPLLDRRDARTLWLVGRFWALLIAGNLAGTLVMGWLLGRFPILPLSMSPALDGFTGASTAGDFSRTFVLAIFGGWLMALMAWLLNASTSPVAHIIVVWLTTAPIPAFGFRNSVSGSAEAFFRCARGLSGWGAMWSDFIIPAYLGNAVGGVLLVALLFYAEVIVSRS